MTLPDALPCDIPLPEEGADDLEALRDDFEAVQLSQALDDGFLVKQESRAFHGETNPSRRNLTLSPKTRQQGCEHGDTCSCRKEEQQRDMAPESERVGTQELYIPGNIISERFVSTDHCAQAHGYEHQENSAMDSDCLDVQDLHEARNICSEEVVSIEYCAQVRKEATPCSIVQNKPDDAFQDMEEGAKGKDEYIGYYFSLTQAPGNKHSSAQDSAHSPWPYLYWMLPENCYYPSSLNRSLDLGSAHQGFVSYHSNLEGNQLMPKKMLQNQLKKQETKSKNKIQPGSGDSNSNEER